ncbi:MAG: DUF3365 domain-containing protein [Verrucomicrobiales bacterium]|nr:DUF3365 domain-containing protein [Verrucomicrobiales bacterium]
MKTLSLQWITMGVLSFAACAQEAGSPKIDEGKIHVDRSGSGSLPVLSESKRKECMERGEEASSALMLNLGKQLKASMAGGDLMAAIAVCQSAAQPITSATGETFQGLSVSRTSLRVRNSDANRPDATDREILTQWARLSAQSQDIEPGIVQVSGTTVRYYRPVFVQEACLKCHGPVEFIEKDVRDFLAEAYPDDEATGYEEGDLRGAFRVDIDLDESVQPFE